MFYENRKVRVEAFICSNVNDSMCCYAWFCWLFVAMLTVAKIQSRLIWIIPENATTATIEVYVIAYFDMPVRGFL